MADSSSSSEVPSGITTRTQKAPAKISDVRLICTEEIEGYHRQLQKSLDDLTTIINEFKDTTGENRREVARRFQTLDDRIATIAKDQNNTTHTRVTESTGQFESKEPRGDGSN
jgi:flagellar capping protein FliD